LRGLGYTVVAWNYRPWSRVGEIDLVAWDGATLAFIEVKTRASEQFGAPESAVDGRKRRRMVKAAEAYLRRFRVDPARARFDVVSVIWGDKVEIRLQKDAFSRREAFRTGRYY
jgi:putative endonuclease